MGQCIYVADRTSSEKTPVTREVASEQWMDPASVGRTLGEDHFMNTTIGLWFYESDLHDKSALRQRLMKLVEHVTSPAYLQHYEDFGRQQGAGSRRSPRT